MSSSKPNPAFVKACEKHAAASGKHTTAAVLIAKGPEVAALIIDTERYITGK